MVKEKNTHRLCFLKLVNPTPIALRPRNAVWSPHHENGLTRVSARDLSTRRRNPLHSHSLGVSLARHLPPPQTHSSRRTQHLIGAVPLRPRPGRPRPPRQEASARRPSSPPRRSALGPSLDAPGAHGTRDRALSAPRPPL